MTARYVLSDVFATSVSFSARNFSASSFMVKSCRASPNFSRLREEETVLHSRKHQFLLRNKQRRVAHLQRACFLLCQEPPGFP